MLAVREWLDCLILEVFSNSGDCMILLELWLFVHNMDELHIFFCMVLSNHLNFLSFLLKVEASKILAAPALPVGHLTA